MAKEKIKRKGISKSIRFEVFKRDKFQCQYCGRSAPDTVLQIDHIKPHAKGGEDSILNFITACLDCNSGKSDRILSDDSAVQKQRTQLELLQERKEQIEMMMEWSMELQNQKDDLLQKLVDYWNNACDDYELSQAGINDIKKLLRQYSFAEVLEAMDIAQEYFRHDSSECVTKESWITALKKVGGICALKRADKEKPYLKDLFIIRGILRNRCPQKIGGEIITMMEDAHLAGVPINEIKKLAISKQNYWHFRDDLEELVKNHSRT